MSENLKAAAAGGDQGAALGSEKTKDIRQTNIIAAKGKSLSHLPNELLTNLYFAYSCR